MDLIKWSKLIKLKLIDSIIVIIGVTRGFQPRSTKRRKKVEQIPYQCANCGTDVSAYGSVPRCLGCGKALCEICNTYLLCPSDFHKLRKKDQKKVKRAKSTLENAINSKVMFTVMPIILGSIGVILLLLMMILRQFLFYFLFGFLGGFLLLCSLLIFFMFHNIEEREARRIITKV
jgi:hypothetical protein